MSKFCTANIILNIEAVFNPVTSWQEAENTAGSLEEDEGLQLPWFEILDALAMSEEKSLRFNELAERVMTHPSSLSRQIDKLEDKQYVAREKSVADDGRAIVLVLTPIGHDVWKSASTTYYRIVRRVFTSWLTETDVVALHRVFSKVLEAE